MSKKNYRDERIGHILEYLDKEGITFPTDGKHRQVIRKDAVEINVAPSVKALGYTVAFSPKGTIIGIKNQRRFLKLDHRANNVGSSSMLSASFFALLLDDQRAFKSLLTRLFKEQYGEELVIDGDVEVELEYVDEEGDKSHIDALIRFTSNGIQRRIYVEVKYCEPVYGPKGRFDKEKDSVEEKAKKQREYIEHTKTCYARHCERLHLDGYLDHCETFEDYLHSQYAKRYQIIRNVSHATLHGPDYCLFLLAKGNEEAVMDIREGLNELSEQNEELIRTRVGVAYFEDLLEESSDLYKKYFGE